jgi:uncharacterized glyoxalase superfamily protein PhnB
MTRSFSIAVALSSLLFGGCTKQREEPARKAQAPAAKAPEGVGANAVKPVPEGFHTITASLIVRGGAKAIEFYKRAFGAELVNEMATPDGKAIVHADLKIGDSMLFLADEMPMPGSPYAAPETTLGKHTVGLWLYVPDVDASMKRAIDAGAKQTMPATDMFWGDRYGRVRDPFGHDWALATHKRDLTPDEIRKGAAAYFAKMAQPKK